MQKLLLAMMIIFLVGFACKKGLSQTSAMDDSTTIGRMLEELLQLKESNLDSALKLSKTIRQKADKLNYQKGFWEAGIEQGIVYNGLGHPDSAISVISQVLKETQDQRNRLVEIKAHLGLISVFQQSSNFQAAVNHLIQAEKLLKNNDPFDLRFDILNKLGIVHRGMKDYTSAMKYFDILENNYLHQLSPVQRFSLFMNKGNVFAVLKEYDKTEELFKKAYEEIKKDNSPVNQALITYNLGALFYKQKRFGEAEEYITKSLDANLKIGDQLKIERCYRVLGSIGFDRKDYYKAKSYYERAMRIAKEINNPRAIMANYDNLYQTYWNIGYYNKNIGDLDKALSYYQRYTQLTDSLYKVDTAAKILELEKQYETEKKNTKIALLEKENQHQDDQITAQLKQHSNLIFLVILISGILCVFVYIFYYSRKVNKVLQLQSKRILGQKNQISEQNLKLQKSLNTQNKLFSIIAHDLRSPLASIFNISNLIGFYIEDENYEDLGKTIKMMDQKTEQILDLTDNLLSWAKSQTEGLQPCLMPLSLKEIFDECLELYRPIAGDKNITIDCLEQTDLFVWADRNMVKTICRNLVNNAIKFTHKNGRIQVWHEYSDQIARFSVKDSGIGIDNAKIATLFEIGHDKMTAGTAGEKSTGLGLSVCKEFVEAMKGKIWVESETSLGSTFHVELLVYNPEIHQKHKQTQKPMPAHLLN